MLNMDFSQNVVINTTEQAWVASPLAGVWRKLRKSARRSLVCLWGFTFLTRINKDDIVNYNGSLFAGRIEKL